MEIDPASLKRIKTFMGVYSKRKTRRLKAFFCEYSN